MKKVVTIIIMLLVFLSGCNIEKSANESSANNNTSNNNSSTPNKSIDERIKGITDFKIENIVSSDLISMFLLENGILILSGNNMNGELGQGNTVSYQKPRIVDFEEKIKLIDAGQSTCIAVGESNSIYSWGASLEMGQEMLINKIFDKPQKINFTENIVDVSLSLDHVLILTEKGDVYSFGNNRGALGYTINNDFVPTPQKINLSNVQSIKTTSSGSVFLTNNNEVYVCGKNEYGEFGDINTSEKIRKLNLDFKVKQIATANSSIYLLSIDGNIYSSGLNAYGELGLGITDETSKSFKKINSNFKVKEIYSSVFSVFHFMSENNELYACGMNLNDELLLGEQGSINKPRKVNLTKKISKFFGKGTGKFFVDNENSFWAYGQSNNGQIIYSSKEINTKEIYFEKKPILITKELFIQ